METLCLDAPIAWERIRQDSLALGFDMASDPLAGSLLRTLAASKPGGQLIELGTGTGLSTAWLLDGMSADARMTSIDNDAQVLDIARQHLGHDSRLSMEQVDGDAYVQHLRPRCADLLFADTWAGKYRHLDAALDAIKPGGFYIIDDMFPQTNWPEGHAHKVDDLMAALRRHPDFVMTPLAWASGMVVAVRMR